MDHFSNFLAKFSKIESPKKKREKIADVLSVFFGVSISPDDISIKQTTLEIYSKEIPKTEIFIKKDDLLALLKEKIPQTPILNIR